MMFLKNCIKNIGVCSFGAGTGYKAFVQAWNNPTNYIAFGLIHDPAVSPNGMTIMVEGAANGRPVGGYWAPGAIVGTSHHIGWGRSPANTINGDCTSPSASGCWGHRDILLGIYVGIHCANCVMGVAFAGNANGWPSDYTGIIGEPVPGYTPHYVYTWQQAVAAGA